MARAVIAVLVIGLLAGCTAAQGGAAVGADGGRQDDEFVREHVGRGIRWSERTAEGDVAAVLDEHAERLQEVDDERTQQLATAACDALGRGEVVEDVAAQLLEQLPDLIPDGRPESMARDVGVLLVATTGDICPDARQHVAAFGGGLGSYADVAAVDDATEGPRWGRCRPGASFVVYHVEGTAVSADITIANAQGNTEQAQGVDVPLGTDAAPGEGLAIGCVPHGEFLYISAQNGGSGIISCRIEADGEDISTASSSGAYAIAGCDATAR